MDNTERIRSELEGTGYRTRVFESPAGTTIAFEYRLECGSHRAKTVQIGVSKPDGEYPGIPPALAPHISTNR